MLLARGLGRGILVRARSALAARIDKREERGSPEQAPDKGAQSDDQVRQCCPPGKTRAQRVLVSPLGYPCCLLLLDTPDHRGFDSSTGGAATRGKQHSEVAGSQRLGLEAAYKMCMTGQKTDR